jgi:hypothetical protein
VAQVPVFGTWDIHVAVQRGQKIHQPFDGKALQLEAVSQTKFVE